MDRQHGIARYWTVHVEDRGQGFTGLQLQRELSGSTTVVAELLFWDAIGQFCLETLGSDVPLDVIEELIAEAKVMTPAYRRLS
jgi:hypothetical protein